MPELPEVQTVVNGLQDWLVDRQILNLECHYNGTVRFSPASSESSLPAKVTSVERRGKYIIINLESLHSIIVHLRMTGKLVQDTSENIESNDINIIHQRACFILSHKKLLRFIDPRTFGKIILCRTDEIESYIPKLGVEPLTDDFTPNYLRSALLNKRAPIKNTLLDQRIVAGLGNIYVCEILYRSGIKPDKQSNQLTMSTLRKIVSNTKEVLSEAIQYNGTSISDYRRIDDKTGEFQNYLRVYQKIYCPLGHSIQNIRLAGRSSFYCPICQKI